MRLPLLTLMLAAVAASAPDARAEIFRGPPAVSYEDAAVASNSAGTIAVAYLTRRGIHVSVSRGGGRFARAVRLAGAARGDRYDGGIRVAVGEAGDMVVAWERFDNSEPAEEYSRDDGCCTRIYAARISASGRRSGPQLLSRRGVYAILSEVALGPFGDAAVSWQAETGGGRWRARTAPRWGRFGRTRTIAGPRRGSDYSEDAGLLSFAGRSLRAIYIRGRDLLERLEGSRPRRLSRSMRTPYEMEGLADAFGRVLFATRDQIVAVPAAGRARVRTRRLRGSRRMTLSGTPAGRAALMTMPEYGRFATVRLGATTGAFGGARRLPLAPGRVGSFHVKAAVARDGTAAVFALHERARRRTLHGSTVTLRGITRRRIRGFSSSARIDGAAYDGAGRAVAIVKDGSRIHAVRG